jgi:hypothetical protein
MRKLELTNWEYDDYRAITGRDDTAKTRTRWLEIIALINDKHYESIDNEIRETITWIDSEILKEEK